MKAIVLAGGLGTRLRARVSDVPKPMAPIQGRPFLEYVLDTLVSGGVESVVLSIGYLGEMIESHFGNSYRGLPLEYSVEHECLGTGGAIAKAVKQYASNAPVLVLNGDTLLKMDLKRMIESYNCCPSDLVMVLRKVNDVSRYGQVIVENNIITKFEEKGGEGAGYINAGIYIIRPEIISEEDLPPKFSFEIDYLQNRLVDIKPRAYIEDCYFIDIGIPEDFDRAQYELPILIK